MNHVLTCRCGASFGCLPGQTINEKGLLPEQIIKNRGLIGLEITEVNCPMCGSSVKIESGRWIGGPPARPEPEVDLLAIG